MVFFFYVVVCVYLNEVVFSFFVYVYLIMGVFLFCNQICFLYVVSLRKERNSVKKYGIIIVRYENVEISFLVNIWYDVFELIN